MNRLSRILYFAALILLGGIALVDYRRIADYRRSLDSQAPAIHTLKNVIGSASPATSRSEKSIATGQPDLAAPSLPTEEPLGPVDPTEVSQWLERVKRLRQIFADRPDQQIPQLALLTDHEWVAIARDAKFETDRDVDRSLAKARTAAKNRFISYLYSAMERYLEAHQGSLPTNLEELLPALAGLDEAAQAGRPPASDPKMLAQYELKASGKLREAADGSIVAEKKLVNEDFDHRIELDHDKGDLVLSEMFTSDDDGMIGSSEAIASGSDETFERSVRAFAVAHGGASPTAPADLIPFLDASVTQDIKASIAEPLSPEELKSFKKAVDQLLSPPAQR